MMLCCTLQQKDYIPSICSYIFFAEKNITVHGKYTGTIFGTSTIQVKCDNRACLKCEHFLCVSTICANGNLRAVHKAYEWVVSLVGQPDVYVCYLQVTTRSGVPGAVDPYLRRLIGRDSTNQSPEIWVKCFEDTAPDEQAPLLGLSYCHRTAKG